MESDRAEADLGIAADIELQMQGEEPSPASQRQPKKRFVGRRQAAENAISGPSSAASGENGQNGSAISGILEANNQ
jgi:2-(3-amino-3-carboxypropyl)histidine synthase